MPCPPKSPVDFRILQDGREIALIKNTMLVIRSRLTGIVANCPCFREIRLVDFWDRRRALDITTATYRGPVTIEMVTTAGEIINRIAVADVADVKAHPRGELIAR